MDVLSFFCIKELFIGIFIFQYGFQNGRQRSRDYFIIISSNESFIYKQHSVKVS